MKHRALIIGAGRIGAGFAWHDLEYTHAGAYKALADRVELVGFVEPDLERRVKANLLWNVPTYDNVPVALEALKPDMVSICVQPEQQREALMSLCGQQQIVGIWCEKPYVCNFDKYWPPIQVNYMRRGDRLHREIASRKEYGRTLEVEGKNDIHTKCHFEDLAKWWGAELVYKPITGPCSYTLINNDGGRTFFPNGGVDGGTCFKNMLGNLLDHMDNGTPLWSPAT
jgi:hypothetical protein